MAKNWTNIGQKIGQKLIKNWSKNGLEIVKIEQKLVNELSKNGQKMVKNWSKIG